MADQTEPAPGDDIEVTFRNESNTLMGTVTGRGDNGVNLMIDGDDGETYEAAPRRDAQTGDRYYVISYLEAETRQRRGTANIKIIS